MNTDTCKHKGQLGNFCSECGEAVRKKCPECGAMELIGRKFCDVEVRAAEKCHQEYRDSIGDLRVGTGFVLALLSLLVGAYFLLRFESISFLLTVPISCCFLGVAWQCVALTRIDKKFAIDFPEYMEALDESGYWKSNI
ncbi:MAG: hypothetical protein UV60_C0004G0035 [Parcubacteria group bacterium GW2011_GWA2_43_11]|nr:MAG: hypothetical protein UV60_C0004G0035 [Parcubacteria group bacterium GW2011_GWA2_43_11]